MFFNNTNVICQSWFDKIALTFTIFSFKILHFQMGNFLKECESDKSIVYNHENHVKITYKFSKF